MHPLPRRTLVHALGLISLGLLLSSLAVPAASPHRRLPTGATLDPAGRAIELGSMPLAMALSPDSTHLAISLGGHREQGIQIVDLERDSLIQTLKQPAAFFGLAFSPDGRTLYVSGGFQDVIYRYAISDAGASLADSIRLDPTGASGQGVRYPAHIALSRDGRTLYVAENLADSLAVVNLSSGRVTQRLATGLYPYGVLVGPEGRVYVSSWGGSWVATFAPASGAALDGAAGSSSAGGGGAASGVWLEPGPRIAVGRHPSAMALNRAGTRLYVARASFDRIGVVDTHANTLLSELNDAAPAGPSEGSTPNGLALSPDERRLLVAEADNNAIAIYSLGDRSRGSALTSAPGAGGSGAARADRDSLIGRVPVEWYPDDVMEWRGHIVSLNGKGPGTGPNPERKQPGVVHIRNRPGVPAPGSARSYTLDQTTGSLSSVEWPDAHALRAYSARVAASRPWGHAAPVATYPPFKHVIYIIRENRTYDQVLGDLAVADGDTSLVFFPRAVTPNAHALAERFGIFDRFFVNAEVSGDGHNWSTAAYAADYVQKTIPSNYSDRGRDYDYDGLNRGAVPDDDVNEPGNGYVWDAAIAAGISLRNYGEFAHRAKDGNWVGNKPALASRTDPAYAGWDLAVPDQARADEWIREFRTSVSTGSMPALCVLSLPNDHTAGAKAKSPTPRAFVADNDLALGRIIDAVSHSPFWNSTVVFVLEDDAQDGPDHVDSHRSPLLVISAYNRPGVVHRFANTSDVLATIAGVLRLHALSQFDYYGRPLSDVFNRHADLTPFTAITPGVPLDEKNPEHTPAAKASSRLDFRKEDRVDDDVFNRLLWAVVKGEATPYPGTRRAPAPVAEGR